MWRSALDISSCPKSVVQPLDGGKCTRSDCRPQQYLTSFIGPECGFRGKPFGSSPSTGPRRRYSCFSGVARVVARSRTDNGAISQVFGFSTARGDCTLTCSHGTHPTFRSASQLSFVNNTGTVRHKGTNIERRIDACAVRPRKQRRGQVESYRLSGAKITARAVEVPIADRWVPPRPSRFIFGACDQRVIHWHGAAPGACRPRLHHQGRLA